MLSFEFKASTQIQQNNPMTQGNILTIFLCVCACAQASSMHLIHLFHTHPPPPPWAAVFFLAQKGEKKSWMTVYKQYYSQQ